MSTFKIVTDETKDAAIKIIGAFVPPVAAAKSVFEWQKNISNNIFLDKLYTILEKPQIVSTDWKKISQKFQADTNGYEKNVKQLIFTIDTINELKMLDVYANLLNAYSRDLLTKDDFFRLTWILANAYYDDLCKVIKIHNRPDTPENEYTGVLSNLQLIEKFKLRFITRIEDIEKQMENKYWISNLGLKMIAFGLDYENYPNYEESLKAYET